MITFSSYIKSYIVSRLHAMKRPWMLFQVILIILWSITIYFNQSWWMFFAFFCGVGFQYTLFYKDKVLHERSFRRFVRDNETMYIKCDPPLKFEHLTKDGWTEIENF